MAAVQGEAPFCFTSSNLILACPFFVCVSQVRLSFKAQAFSCLHLRLSPVCLCQNLNDLSTSVCDIAQAEAERVNLILGEGQVAVTPVSFAI